MIKETKIVIAGYPKQISDKLKEMGITSFIHITTDVIETLQGFQDEIENKYTD